MCKCKTGCNNNHCPCKKDDAHCDQNCGCKYWATCLNTQEADEREAEDDIEYEVDNPSFIFHGHEPGQQTIKANGLLKIPSRSPGKGKLSVSAHVARGSALKNDSLISATAGPYVSVHYALASPEKFRINHGRMEDNDVVARFPDEGTAGLANTALHFGSQDEEVVVKDYLTLHSYSEVEPDELSRMGEYKWNPSLRATLSNWKYTPKETFEMLTAHYYNAQGEEATMSAGRLQFLEQYFKQSGVGVVVKSLDNSRPVYHKYYCQEVRKEHEKNATVVVLPLAELQRLGRLRKTTRVCSYCKKIQRIANSREERILSERLDNMNIV